MSHRLEMLKRVVKQDNLEDGEMDEWYPVYPLLHDRGMKPFLSLTLVNLVKALAVGYGGRYDVGPGWPEFTPPDSEGYRGYWFHPMYRMIKRISTK